MISQATLVSPRLAALQEELLYGNHTALVTFWREITAQGAPLIETIPGDDIHVLVTFLWQATEEIQNVVVAGALVGWNISENQMSRMLNTDLWYKTYIMRSDTRAIYRFSPNDTLLPWSIDNMEERLAACRRDPLNSRTFLFPRNQEDPWSSEIHMSALELPAAPPQPWIMPRVGVPKGELKLHHIHSHMLRNSRRAWVYTPPGYEPSAEPYGLLLLFDGSAYLELIPTPTILDNLLAEGLLPPMVAVMLDSPPESRNHELTCHRLFVDFLVQELVPWLRRHYYITADPMKTIVGGSSAGGLAAAYTGLHAPEIFGNVLSQSGSFWWNWDAEEKIAQQWLTRQFAVSPRQPLRFYIDVGRLERIPGYDLLMVNRHLYDVLLAKGYPVHYAELGGGHEYISWRGGFSNGLLALAGV
ncbi:MAG: enterochelin esterase [Chloroflexi bacterium]|nr:MAG: enterochelin esterase [Chloroflexota bacterium]